MKERNLLKGIGTWPVKWWQRYVVRRNYKDQLFVRLFRDPKALLSLYNALNHTDYSNPQELEFTTIEDAVYMGLKEDCSFIVGSDLNLYEHQSTFNPNMPLRGLLYLATIYQGYVAENDEDKYGSRLVRLPTPKFVVFYNGEGDRPEQETLRLSDAFRNGPGCLECEAVMLNINAGHNPELMENCRTLYEYSVFIGKMRECLSQGYTPGEATDMACAYCIEHDILREFLLKNQSEVKKMLLTEYNAKAHYRVVRQEGVEDGRAEGREQELIETCQELGYDYGFTMNRLMTKFSLSQSDAEFRMKLYWKE